MEGDELDGNRSALPRGGERGSAFEIGRPAPAPLREYPSEWPGGREACFGRENLAGRDPSCPGRDFSVFAQARFVHRALSR